MGDDGKKLPHSNNPVDNSSLLTDWLFKQRLDNISYISASPSVHSQISKSLRKGGIFDSRDVIRPTVQLFKNIKNKNRRRNETPSPQRNKAKVSTAPSPTKESNRIFSHRGAGEESLNVYRKIFTYGRVKQDRVSKDKIESAVALFRQREQDRETSANKVTAPDKPKKPETVNINGKVKKRSSPIKPTTKENANRIAETCKSVEKQKDSREAEAQSRESRNDDDSEHVRSKKTFRSKMKSPNKNKVKQKKIAETYEEEKNYEKGEFTEEIENQSAAINIENKPEKNIKEIQNIKTVKKMNLVNSENQPEGNQISVINISDTHTEYSKIDLQSRKSLIRSLKSKYSRLDVAKDAVPARKQISADYIIVKPAFTHEMVGITAPPKPKAKKSVDDLLKEYRIKYRNMMKVR